MSVNSTSSASQITAQALPLPAGAAQDGSDITTPTAMPAGGSGIRGWLSAIWTKLNGSIAVTGTFFQATQPVSIAATINTNTGLTQPLTDTRLRASSVPVTVGNFPATQNTDVSDRAARALGVVASITNAVTVTPPTLTKGTQGATGFATQDLKDSGRVLCTFTASAVATVAAEALISLTPYRDLVAGAAATTFPVTAGKRLRLQALVVTIRCTGTVNVGGLVRLRMLAGAVLVGSPVHLSVGGQGSNLATAVIGNAMSYFVDLPDGYELSNAMQFGLTQLFSATTATIDVHVVGYEY